MKVTSSFRTTFKIITLAASVASFGLTSSIHGEEAPAEFTKPTIDIGLVVKDAERAAAFLTNAIGFKEVGSFAVTRELGRKVGLIDGHAVEVRVFALGEGDGATHLKLLSFPQAPGQQPDQRSIHSALGFRYLTLFVEDIDRALARLEQARVPLLGESPVDLGGGTFLVTVKDPDGNFYELIGRRR
ncbi:MAG: VOC family protein [Verrucomicrobia bacterium]|nr:VOC family protein [Verrucomicrobiota bacterium]